MLRRTGLVFAPVEAAEKALGSDKLHHGDETGGFSFEDRFGLVFVEVFVRFLAFDVHGVRGMLKVRNMV